MQWFGKNVSHLILCMNREEVCDASQHLVTNQVAIKFNMLGAFMKYGVGSNV